MWKLKSITKKKTLIILVVLFITLVASGLVYLRIKSDDKRIDLHKSAVELKKAYSSADNKNLKSKDYESYQGSLLEYANLDIQANKYASADKVLKEIVKNVPSDKLTTETYVALSKVAKKQGYKEAYRKYTEELIIKLNQENRNDEAKIYSQELSDSK